MLIRKCSLLIVLMLFMGNIVSAQTAKYIGSDKCKICHNKPANGDAYGKWAATLHAKALKSLSNQASIDYAKKNGIADASKEPKCLKCHSTFSATDEKLHGGILATEGVSCESCHGPGSVYKAPTLMKNRKMAMEKGLILPKKEVCLNCHNKENPFYKEFNYEVYVAKIAHPDPLVKK
jgi:hypothetical protein